MALAVPGVYLMAEGKGRRSGDRPLDDRGDPALYRLPPNHAEDLRDVARGVEETNAGVCCRYLVDHLAGGGGHADVDDDGYVHHLEAVEKFCERYGVWRHPAVATWRHRVTRCRRALSRLRAEGQHDHAAALHVAYGYPDPIVRQLDLAALVGERFASLVRYTEPVEQRRMAMARAEAQRGERAEYVPRLERGGGGRVSFGELAGSTFGETPEMFRLAAKHAERGAARRTEISSEEGARLFDLERHRGLVAHAERAISSGDALRDALALGERRPGEHDEAFRDRRARDKAERAQFLVEAKLAAARMLAAAERAYHAAWLRSAAP